MNAPDLIIEVDPDTPHTWYGPGVHAYACNATEGLHVCMRGATVSGRPNPGPHRCACHYRWEGTCGIALATLDGTERGLEAVLAPQAGVSE